MSELEGKDIEYLDKEFSKGKTKFRGQAMVLLALAREHSKEKCLEIIEGEKIVDAEGIMDCAWNETLNKIQQKIKEMKG